MDTAVILITHDLGVIAETADWVAVMYAGQIVEQSGVTPLFEQPLHPYTRGLLNSIPILGESKHRLADIDGVVPNLVDLPQGCNFAPRCKARVRHGLAICEKISPDLKEVMLDHVVRCWLYQDHEEHKAVEKP
jgi:oligopeptide/dipeptide ABC transporter ATP-binding protein